MPVYIVQHGKSLSKAEDPEKGLAPQGKVETERIAEVARGYSVRVRTIVHSGKKRARETAEIFAAALAPKNGIMVRGGMNPMDDVRAFRDELTLDADLMLVGHLPFLERLIGLLVCDDPERTVFMLQNSGMLCLDRDSRSGRPAIRWALMPHIG